MAGVTTLILAGGQSSRMGQDKALLDLGGERLIQRTCRLALACTDSVAVVTPWPDRYRPLLPPAVEWIEETPSPGDVNLGQGPLVALTQALTTGWQGQTDPATPGQTAAWVLALACDLPNLTVAILQTWINDLAAIAPSTLAYLPQRQGRWEPLCGFYRSTCGASWQSYIAAGGRSFQGWLAQHPVAPIPQVEEAWLTNLNTPTDLDQWAANRSGTG